MGHLLPNLESAKRHVRNQEARVLAQAESIARMQCLGHSTKPAEALLLTMRDVLAVMQDHLDILTTLACASLGQAAPVVLMNMPSSRQEDLT